MPILIDSVIKNGIYQESAVLSNPASCVPRISVTLGVFVVLALCLLVPSQVQAQTSSNTHPSVAFYYGTHPPLDVLRAFDWVVVQPHGLQRATKRLGPWTTEFAYLSLGEMEKSSAIARNLPGYCHLGTNRPWHSIIINQAKVACRSFYLGQVFKPLLARGYRNFFFDTLDSYEQVLKTPAQRTAYRQGLTALIKAIHHEDPQGKFILNRGFELLDALKNQGIVGVAAESLYRGWNQKAGRYIHVKRADTQWLLGQFERVRKMGLIAIAIDYLPPARRRAAEHLARRIESHGIVPYVTDKALVSIGVSTITPLPRRVLMLYDGPYRPMNNNLNWYAAMPLNYLGYATQAINVSHQLLPTGPLSGQVAGIVTWFDSDHFPHAAETWRWLHEQMQAGVPVAILGQFGLPLDAGTFVPLGLRPGKTAPYGLLPAKVANQTKGYFGFESPVLPSTPDFRPLHLVTGRSLLTITVAGNREVAAALTPWGGYVLAPYVLRNLPQGDLKVGELQAAWVLDPFRFYRAALRLPQAPAYDITTQSGRRLLFGLIDGDGFASNSWIEKYRGQPAARVILTAVLKRFRLPITVAPIASEFANHGLYQKSEVDRLRPIARAIFRLPWVEMGSHTYSHPFDWPALERNPNLSAGLHIKHGTHHPGAYVNGGSPQLKYSYNLPVPGYRFSPEQEVTGAAKIIDQYLAPPGKRVRVIQWSGDTNPDAQVLGIAYRDGLANINGNNSTIDHAHPSLTNVTPLGVWKGRYFQVYSPIANEDQYTHGWQPPYCGYNKVIQTLQMTDQPRRLAPMEIYYHFYSGARPCALKDLIRVYRWAAQQPSTPIFASTYSHLVIAFESAALARSADGFLLRGYGPDQQIRIPVTLGYPNFTRSHNIAGFDDTNGQRYIHLGPGDQARLVLVKQPPTQPYLISANGRIEALTRQPGIFDLRLRAYVPLRVRLGNATRCRISINGKIQQGKLGAHGEIHFRLQAQQAYMQLACPGEIDDPDRHN